MSNSNKKEKYSVLNQRYSAGPHGIGDPDDLHLRKVEKEVIIAQIVRDRARTEKCILEFKDFVECCKYSQLAMVFTCRKQNHELKNCVGKWYKDDKFWEECTQLYLKDRSEYRRTGESKKIREFKKKAAELY